MLFDADGGLGEALGTPPLTVVGVRVAVVSAHRSVGAVTADWLAGAVRPTMLQQAHGAELTLFLTFLWGTHTHTQQSSEDHQKSKSNQDSLIVPLLLTLSQSDS